MNYWVKYNFLYNSWLISRYSSYSLSHSVIIYWYLGWLLNKMSFQWIDIIGLYKSNFIDLLKMFIFLVSFACLFMRFVKWISPCLVQGCILIFGKRCMSVVTDRIHICQVLLWVWFDLNTIFAVFVSFVIFIWADGSQSITNGTVI